MLTLYQEWPRNLLDMTFDSLSVKEGVISTNVYATRRMKLAGKLEGRRHCATNYPHGPEMDGLQETAGECYMLRKVFL